MVTFDQMKENFNHISYINMVTFDQMKDLIIFYINMVTFDQMKALIILVTWLHLTK